MGRWTKLRRILAKLFGSAMLMLAGAWLLMQYIDLAQPSLAKSLDTIELGLMVGFWLTYFAAELLQPDKRIAKRAQEPSPRWSGSYVVIATGIAGAFFLSKGDIENKGIWIALIALLTVAVAAIVWRFATVHADEIGEAVFDGPNTGKL